jgi:hypothetical protein
VIKIRRKVKPGERAPWGYAVAYQDLGSWYGIAYPVGIHLLVQLGKSLYLRFMKGIRPAWWEREISKAISADDARKKQIHMDSINRAHERGRHEGHRQGWAAALEHIEKQIDEEYGGDKKP